MVNGNNRLKFFILVSFLILVYFFIFGESGLFERLELQKRREHLANRIGSLKQENADLEQLLSRYKNGEFLDEETAKAGFVEPGKKIVIFKKGEDQKPPEKKNRIEMNEYFSEPAHFRILWIVISLLMVLFYLTFKKKDKEERME